MPANHSANAPNEKQGNSDAQNAADSTHGLQLQLTAAVDSIPDSEAFAQHKLQIEHTAALAWQMTCFSLHRR